MSLLFHLQGELFCIRAELKKSGTFPTPEIISIVAPDSAANGTSAGFNFKGVPGSVAHGIYISLDQDGSGAILLGKNVKKSGALIGGFRADTDFYAFIAGRDKENRHSVPSAPFKFRMQNQFGMR